MRLLFLILLVVSFQYQTFAENHCELREQYLTCGDIKLPYAIVPAKKQPATGALLYIPGGPGQGGQTSSSRIQFWEQYFSEAGREFDIILYEPRGTPSAKPNYICENLEFTRRTQLARNLSADAEKNEIQTRLAACLTRYQTESLSLKHHVDDVTTLINLLPYTNIRLWGDSWGSRVALLVQSRKITHRVLDGVYPPGVTRNTSEDPDEWRFDIHRKHFNNWARSRQRKSDFDLLLEKSRYRLASKPFIYLHGENQYILNEHRLNELAMFVLYNETMRFPFYESLQFLSNTEVNNLREVDVGKASLEFILERYIESYLDPSFSSLAWYVSECVEFNKGVCSSSRLNKQASSLSVKSAIPVLILAGEDDPVTPLGWATDLTKALNAEATLITIENAGHGILMNDYCRPALLNDFFANKVIIPTDYCEATL